MVKTIFVSGGVVIVLSVVVKPVQFLGGNRDVNHSSFISWLQ